MKNQLKMKSLTKFLLSISLVLSISSCSQPSILTPEEAHALAKEAYICANPVADNYLIYYSPFVDKTDPEFKAPFNQIKNFARVYTPDDKTVQTPNSDDIDNVKAIQADYKVEPLSAFLGPTLKLWMAYGNCLL